MPTAKFNKKFILFLQSGGKLPLDSLNWPAFDYYGSLRKLKEGVGNHSPANLSLEGAARLACLEISAVGRATTEGLG